MNPVPIGSMYAIYGNIYHQYTPNVSIYIYHPWILWGIALGPGSLTARFLGHEILLEPVVQRDSYILSGDPRIVGICKNYIKTHQKCNLSSKNSKNGVYRIWRFIDGIPHGILVYLTCLTSTEISRLQRWHTIFRA